MVEGGRDDNHPLRTTRQSSVPVSYPDSSKVSNSPPGGHIDNFIVYLFDTLFALTEKSQTRFSCVGLPFDLCQNIR